MGIFDTIKENARFRVNSLRAMVMGTSDVARAEPLDRRKEIMRRRREAVGDVLEDDDVGGGADVSSSSTTRRSSTISDPDADDRAPRHERESRDKSTGSTTQSTTPSMSEINRGTLERARDRGYST